MVMTLDEEYFDNLDENGKEICQIETFHTPKKNKGEEFSLETPLKNQIKVLEFHRGNEVIKAAPIFSKDHNYWEGKKSFVDVVNPESNVGLDCDDEDWDTLADSYFKEFVDNLKPKNQEEFIATLINHVQKNKDHLKDSNKIFFMQELDSKPVCRHYATLALPIVARILNHKSRAFNGTIHQMASTKLDHNLKDLSGHAWNVIKLKDKKGVEHIWAVDFYNNLFTNVSKEKSLEKMLSCSSVLGEDKIIIKEKSLASDKFFYSYVKVVKERLNINMGNEITVYNDGEILDVMSNKRVLNQDNFPKTRTETIFNNNKQK